MSCSAPAAQLCGMEPLLSDRLPPLVVDELESKENNRCVFPI